jgi:hypothetical protein
MPVNAIGCHWLAFGGSWPIWQSGMTDLQQGPRADVQGAAALIDRGL